MLFKDIEATQQEREGKRWARMDKRTEMYRSQLLNGADFLSKYSSQLRSLYEDRNFMRVIEEIRGKLPVPEDSAHIDEIKDVAKKHLFYEKAVYD